MVFNIMTIRLLVIMGAESSEALAVHVDLQRVDGADEEVEAEVKLAAVEQHWRNVVLRHQRRRRQTMRLPVVASPPCQV